MGKKKCCTCHRTKRYDLFDKNASTKDGYAHRCKSCRRKTGETKQNYERRRDHIYRTQYGISLDEYDELVKKQGNLCAICLTECASGHRLSIDHNHETGKVRGLLCKSCNLGIGKLGDNIDNVRRALKYLSK